MGDSDRQLVRARRPHRRRRGRAARAAEPRRRPRGRRWAALSCGDRPRRAAVFRSNGPDRGAVGRFGATGGRRAHIAARSVCSPLRSPEESGSQSASRYFTLLTLALPAATRWLPRRPRAEDCRVSADDCVSKQTTRTTLRAVFPVTIGRLPRRQDYLLWDTCRRVCRITDSTARSDLHHGQRVAASRWMQCANWHTKIVHRELLCSNDVNHLI